MAVAPKLTRLACAAVAVLPLVALAAGARKDATPDDSIAQRVRACTACHGDEGRATNEGFYPRIAGKPAGYLFNQLRHFRDGRRGNPSMVYMVSWMSDDYLREIARFFADQKPPYPPPPALEVAAATLARGRTLVLEGDRSRGVPACAACHGEALAGRMPAVPGLLGMPRDYLNAQFGAWRNGARRSDPPDCMRQVAERLAPDDVAAATAWLSLQPVPSAYAPQEMPVRGLPLDCGGLGR